MWQTIPGVREVLGRGNQRRSAAEGVDDRLLSRDRQGT